MIHKKGLATLALLLLSLSLFVSCTQAHSQTAGNDSEPQIPLEDLEFVLETPSEELQARFVEEYIAYQKYDPEDHPTVAIERWYGSFGDIHFLFIYHEGWIYHTAHFTDIVADSVFEYPTSQRIKVWVDGQFLSIEDAYEQNLITKEMVATIADIRNGIGGPSIKMR